MTRNKHYCSKILVSLLKCPFTSLFSVLLKASVCLKWRLMKLKLVRVYSWTSSRISWGIHYLYSAVSFTPGLEIEICIFYCYVRALLTTYWGLKPLVPHNGNLALLMFRKRNMCFIMFTLFALSFLEFYCDLRLRHLIVLSKRRFYGNWNIFNLLLKYIMFLFNILLIIE